MKTEMKIKTGRWSEKKEEGENDKHQKKDRLSVGIRAGTCFLLLSLLAVGGYAGSKPHQERMTSAPVTVRPLIEDEIKTLTYEEICARQERDRQEEIALLDSVIDHEGADAATKNNAITQKIQLVQRMETESAVKTALAHMGFEEIGVLCGAGQLTLIMREDLTAGEENTLRVIDAAASVAQLDAKNVKIILVKK